MSDHSPVGAQVRNLLQLAARSGVYTQGSLRAAFLPLAVCALHGEQRVPLINFLAKEL
jgi:hypothetical protein